MTSSESLILLWKRLMKYSHLITINCAILIMFLHNQLEIVEFSRTSRAREIDFYIFWSKFPVIALIHDNYNVIQSNNLKRMPSSLNKLKESGKSMLSKLHAVDIYYSTVTGETFTYCYYVCIIAFFDQPLQCIKEISNLVITTCPG